MRYVESRIDSESEDLTCRLYMSESARVLVENTAKMFGGAIIEKSLMDILNIAEKPVDNRSAKEIIEDIKNKL